MLITRCPFAFSFIIIIIIMSLFYEDDIFSKQCTNITYGPLQYIHIIHIYIVKSADKFAGSTPEQR